MLGMLVLSFAACDGGKGDSAGTHPSTDDSSTDDSGTNVPDDSATDDSGTNKVDDSATDDSATDDSATDDSATDDSATDDSGCAELVWYFDGDHDGYGSGGASLSCDSPGKDWVGVAGDCNDGDANVSPVGTETCDGLDNDCDLLTDDDDSSVTGTGTGYLDLDGDGYGGTPLTACDLSKTSPTNEDCDDGDPDINFYADEVCNSIDDDCDGAVDDADSDLVGGVWYQDNDGDGYGDPTTTITLGCTGITGLVDDGNDCDDSDASVYPGAPELCDDIQSDCNTMPFDGDVGVATFYPASGGAEDWTADMSGKYGAAATVDITDDGELKICDGTWYVAIEVSATTATVTGLHGSALTTLSGGDDARPLWVSEDYATVLAQGLSLTEGNDCVGAAVSTASSYSCMGGGASWGDTIDVSLTLSDVRIENNNPAIGSSLGVILLGSGTVLALENTTIANNGIQAVWAKETPISCIADPKTDGGVWGNSDGIFEWSPWSTDPYIISSEGCDWDGSGGAYTPYSDVAMQDSAGVYATYDFGDDADFLCDASLASCTK